MQYLNIKTEYLHSPEFVGSKSKDRGTWLALSLWCAQQENGGRIENAASWKDWRWQQTCGVTLRQVKLECDLWWWDGNDLVLWNYPGEQEKTAQARRKAGAQGGRPKKETPQSNNRKVKQTDNLKVKPGSNGKEGKGRERKEIINDGAGVDEKFEELTGPGLELAEPGELFLDARKVSEEEGKKKSPPPIPLSCRDLRFPLRGGGRARLDSRLWGLLWNRWGGDGGVAWLVAALCDRVEWMKRGAAPETLPTDMPGVLENYLLKGLMGYAKKHPPESYGSAGDLPKLYDFGGGSAGDLPKLYD